MERTVYRTCTLCEACCGIEVQLKDERIVAIRGDERDPLSRGHICAKAPALKDLHEDPDRLRHPIRRTGSGWERIGWREAIDFAAKRILAVGDEVVIRPMMYLALSYDHRIVDGREAVRCLAKIKHGLEEPTRLLLEI